MFAYVIIIHHGSQNVHKKSNINQPCCLRCPCPPALLDNLIHKGGATSTANLDQDLH